MFYGEYRHTIDKKGRLIIPAKFRETLKENYVDKFYITKGLDRCLFVFTEDEWKRQEQRFKTASFTKEKVRKFSRFFFGGAYEVECDKQGRILLPQSLKDFATISRDVVIVGVSSRFEIWNGGEWEKFYEAAKETIEEIAERLADDI